MTDISLSESWKKDTYESKLIDLMFDIGKIQTSCLINPVLENLKIYYAHIVEFQTIIAYSEFYLKKMVTDDKNNILIKLQEIQHILYGNHSDPSVIKLWEKYKIMIKQDRHGKIIVHNSQNIVDVLRNDVFFVLNQWALKLGFLLAPKRHKAVGMEAIQDVADM